MTHEEILQLLYDETLVGNAPVVRQGVEDGLEQGLEPERMLYDALIPSLEEVGARFERGDFFVPEMLIAARAMQGALDILRPLLAETGIAEVGTFLMGTVKGDVHDIGKNLCNIMLEGAGFRVIDLGVNVPPEKFIEQIEEHNPDIVGFSAFLTTTMPMFKANINALEKAGLRDRVIVMVGGAPVTQEYADAVGADGYSADASSAVKKAKELIAAAAREGAGMSGGGIKPAETVLRSATTEVTIGAGRPFCIIGERINPTGRKKFAEELRGGDLSTVTVDALAQVEAGADMLDVNAGIPLVDEAELLGAMLRTVQEAVDAPICIDSSVIEALESGLAVYEGRALVNSVTAEDERLQEILPIVANYGAAVIGLANDETGIPETPEKRLECARKIISAAADFGIARDDVIIDPLAMTVGADPTAVKTTLDHHQPDPRRARREHVPRRVQRLVRAARSPRAQRRVPADGDGGRSDQRDHVHGPAGRRRGPGQRPAARARRVGRELDRRAPGAAGGGGQGAPVS